MKVSFALLACLLSTSPLGLCAIAMQGKTASVPTALLERLSKRDSALSSLYLEFKAWEELPTRDTSSGEAETLYTEVGWWAKSGDASAIEVTTIGPGGTKRRSRGAWDGATYSFVSNLDGDSPIIIKNDKKGAPYSLYSPDFFGTQWGDLNWSFALFDTKR